MLTAYKYRLYPTAEQVKKLSMHFGHARHVYNWGLAAKAAHYEETGKSLSKRALQDAMVLRARVIRLRTHGF